jgi:hypothetical protein
MRRQNDGKLIPAEAGYGISDPDALNQPMTDLPKQLVAQCVAARIVDILEMIQIDAKQRAAPPAIRGSIQYPREVFEK